MTEEGRRLLAAATERPWFSTDMTGVPDAYGFLRGPREAIFGSEPDGTRPGVAPVVFGHENAALIVAAVNQYEALLDVADAAAALMDADIVVAKADWSISQALADALDALPPSRDSTPDPLE